MSCANSSLVASANQNERNVSSSNAGVEIIPDASEFDQIFVISDVHGMYNQLVTLLRAGSIIDIKNNWIAGKSVLIVNGDSIDKGPQSIDVIDLWIRLKEQAASASGKLIHVLGNHEAEFLADPKNDKKAVELMNELKEKNIPLSDLVSIQTPRGSFLYDEPLAVRVGQWLFCHSGFYPDIKWSDFQDKAQKILSESDYENSFLIGDDSILEAKDWEKDKSTKSDVLKRMDQSDIFGIVFGHQPAAFGIKGRSAAKHHGRLIKIDNGMAPEAGSYAGSLLVFVKPGQMNSMSYPDIKIILPNGKKILLLPE